MWWNVMVIVEAAGPVFEDTAEMYEVCAVSAEKAAEIALELALRGHPGDAAHIAYVEAA